MPVKKAAKKKIRKAAPKKKAVVKKPKLVCGVCGMRLVVDKACGCVEEHALICCGQPMQKS